MSDTLPQFLVDLLNSPPMAGEGVHAWLYRVARQLHAHLPAVQIARLLEAQVQKCGRKVTRHEIEDAVANSFKTAWQPNGKGSTAVNAASYSKWPEPNLETIQDIASKGIGLADLWEQSPIRIKSNESKTEEIIDLLYPGNPFLCCGKSQMDFDTRPREEWRGELASQQLIVPSPMLAKTGLTQDGRESKHTLANTGARRFLVWEFDKGTLDAQAAILLHLARNAPLVCVVFSGGKSLHGWFFCAGQAEERLLAHMRYAVSLGADPVTWTRSQFVRMPDGARENGRRQGVYWLNLEPLEVEVSHGK